MRPTFDIFTVSPDGEPVWIESVETLENAREDLMETARIAPRRDCFVYSDGSGIVEVVLRADFQGLRRTYSLTGEHDNSCSYRSFLRRPVHIPSSN
jgi:phosphoketolase